ncbi:GIN domain-containing protein [Novosphingobium soli]|uniref:GIN domain-containing protein n=1 Tax=Novosphingobium soli TaxID=574956 RepID=A0ABV6D0M1_9SPHN
MLRKLLIVFASGVILSIIAFSAAWLAGGDKLRDDVNRKGWDWHIGPDDDDDHHGPRKTRVFAVQSGSQLAMEVPVDLVFTRGDKAEMTVEGPADVVDRLVWEGGRLSLNGSARIRHGLKVRITAPEIAGLDLDAPGAVKLHGLDQEALRIAAQGAIDLDADGRVNRMSVSSDGAGNLDLGKVAARDATIRIDGVGSVTLGATGVVDVEINGAGNVTLVRKPAVLRSQMNGIGDIDHDY